MLSEEKLRLLKNEYRLSKYYTLHVANDVLMGNFVGRVDVTKVFLKLRIKGIGILNL